MYYTGIDLHKKTCFLTTVDEKRRMTVHKAHLENTEGSLLSYFQVLPGDTKIVIESWPLGIGYMICSQSMGFRL